ncbi:hypothetical protein L227DRAFT_128255 [Lentinus tigrinus ALCF2SS1-6]|uniref:Uncharacterized protein n=1 Tax=Lentinus tigrinus ALCF2SS1-6 TaxID=1328759 RepID=A0A5C2SSE7_9APHY|nr:hypothetical protein L227DRAFT_128255 [Lentinus tigrinus ALCF2SS1-6]
MFKLPLGHICNVAIARRAHQGYLPSATDEMTSLAAACCCCLAQSPSPSRRQSLSAGDLIEHVAWAPRGVVESEDGDRLSLSYSALSSESAAGSTSVFYHPSLSIAKRRAQHSSRRCLKPSDPIAAEWTCQGFAVTNFSLSSPTSHVLSTTL